MSERDRHNPAGLKGDIDAGRTGDKTPGFDPGAAPLGTDEEAAGTPTAQEQIDAARRAETSGVQHDGSAAHAATPPARPPSNSQERKPVGLLMAIAVGVIVAALIGTWFAIAD